MTKPAIYRDNMQLGSSTWADISEMKARKQAFYRFYCRLIISARANGKFNH